MKDNPKYEIQEYYLKKATATKELIKLSAQNFDLYINLCDGAFDEDRAGTIEE